jgi:Bifunctional DNA primase/polymerase, N-terminal/Prophage CP4-57 regulatory protein (AlpA)
MKSPLEIVLEYIDRHWAPIPVPFKEKNPRITAWQKQRITRETAGQYFNSAAQNIGVILGPASGGLTDIDLDCSEAIGLASYFLPRTGAILGAPPKRNSLLSTRRSSCEIVSPFPKRALSGLSRFLGPEGPIPVSKSTWWAGVKSRRFPEPVKLGPRTTAWRVEDIRSLIDRGIETGDDR